MKNNCNNCIYYSHCIHKEYYALLEDNINEGLSDTPFICNIECSDFTLHVPAGYAGDHISAQLSFEREYEN